jgi:hypothetical protein
MDEKEKKECKECLEGCWHTMRGFSGRHFFLRWILGIIILLIVFWFGFKLGEFKSYLKGDYNYGYEFYNNRQMMNPEYYGYYGMPMMRYWYGYNNQQQPTPKQ